MIPQSEIDDFLKTVENREVQAVVPPVNTNTTENHETDDDTISTITSTKKKDRHIWKMKLVKQSDVGSMKATVNPFLSDGNFQELYFSEKLLACAPICFAFCCYNFQLYEL